jgi:high-affinity Fe2+/Pb2+ permease
VGAVAGITAGAVAGIVVAAVIAALLAFWLSKKGYDYYQVRLFHFFVSSCLTNFSLGPG